MSESRRSFFRNAAAVGAGLMGWAESLDAQEAPVGDPRIANHAHKPTAGPKPLLRCIDQSESKNYVMVGASISVLAWHYRGANAGWLSTAAPTTLP